MSVRDELAARLREEGGLLAGALLEHPAVAASPSSVPPRLAVAVAAIREGYLLHYGAGGLLAVENDPDLALLAGDRLYALGIGDLAEVGDLAAVRTMAEVIARSAAAHAAGDPAGARQAWEIGTLALAGDR